MAAKEGASLSDLDQLLICPLCNKTYTSPMNLVRCSHVYCLECIIGRFGDKDILACPMATCGQLCEKSQLKRDERTERLMELFKSRQAEKRRIETTELPCQACCKKEAKWACHECEQYLCDGVCSQSHRTLKGLKDHNLISIADIKQEKINTLRTLKEKIETGEKLCFRKISTLEKIIETAEQNLSNSIQQIRQSEKRWIETIRELHEDVLRDVKERTDKLLNSVRKRRNNLSAFRDSITEEIKRHKTVIKEQNTRFLLDDRMYNSLIESDKSISQRTARLSEGPVLKISPCVNFVCADSKTELSIFKHISQVLTDQITETSVTDDPGADAKPEPSARKPLTLKQKSADSPNICSLNSLARSKNLIVQKIYKFKTTPAPKKMKCIGNELYFILSGGKIRIVTVTGSDVISKDITVRQRRRGGHLTESVDIEYYATSVAEIKTGIIAALGRQKVMGTTPTDSLGLALIDKEGSVQVEIMKGSFLDVFSDLGIVYGLTNPNSEKGEEQLVHVLHHHRHKWVCVRTITLEDKASRLLVVQAKILYTSCSTDTVIKYDLKVESPAKQLKLVIRPKTARQPVASASAIEFRLSHEAVDSNTHNALLCFADPQGSVLVADFTGNSLHYITSRYDWHEIISGGAIRGPWDADMNDDGDIWLLANEDRCYGLYRIYSNL